MAKVFLDANIFIDIIEARGGVHLEDVGQDEVYISPLSIGILTYLYKYSMPNKKLADYLSSFNVVPFEYEITQKSLIGPVKDFEDNIQLHSAAEAECDTFVTNDLELLKMGFFGKVKIVNKPH